MNVLIEIIIRERVKMKQRERERERGSKREKVE